MTSWDKQKVGTWRLSAHITPGGGEVEEFGEFSTFRDAVEAARAIAKHAGHLNRWSASYKRSNKRKGAEVDGFYTPIRLDGPGDYDPHIELALPDGQNVWLEDVVGFIMDGLAAKNAA